VTGASLRRAFLAVVPPGEVLDAVDGLLERSPDRRFKWTTRDQWHVTVQFYGRVRDAGELVAALRAALGAVEPVTARLRGAGAFRDAKRADVFWLGLEVPEAFADLHAAVCAASAAFVAPRDRVVFTPHLTLARLRRAADLRPEVDTLEGVAVGPAWTVRELVLFESETRREGALHHEVARIPLRGPANGA